MFLRATGGESVRYSKARTARTEFPGAYFVQRTDCPIEKRRSKKSFLTMSMRPCVKGVGTYLKTPEKMRVGVRDIERQHRHHLGCEEACSAYYWSVQRVQVLLCQLCGCSMTTASVWRWSVESLIQSKMWYSRAFESQEETRLREYQEHEHEMVDGGAGERQMRSGARV